MNKNNFRVSSLISIDFHCKLERKILFTSPKPDVVILAHIIYQQINNLCLRPSNELAFENCSISTHLYLKYSSKSILNLRKDREDPRKIKY
jgi:hypothetical protein